MHEPEEFEDLGLVDFLQFIEIFRSINWKHEANQAEWAKKASPTVTVTNQSDGCTLWVSAAIADSFLDANVESNERFNAGEQEPRFSVGMENPPKISNVMALDPHGIGDEFGLTVFATDPIEECFKWFFQEDYRSLYESYRWV